MTEVETKSICESVCNSTEESVCNTIEESVCNSTEESVCNTIEESVCNTTTTTESVTVEKSNKMKIILKEIKLGSVYKKSKRYFINNFKKYIEYNKDDKKILNLSTNIISKIYDYIDIFLILDLEDLVYIISRNCENTMEMRMHIFSYLENLFNDRLYSILVKDSVKIKHNALLNSKIYLENKDDPIIEEYIHKNTLLYVGIIKTEIFKILILKRIITNYLLSMDLHNPILLSFMELIQKSKRLIIYYYNDLKTNFSMCNLHINDCKNLIVENKILI